MPTWRNSNFPAEKSGKYYLNQVDTVNIISDVTWVSDTPWYDDVHKTLHLCRILLVP